MLRSHFRMQFWPHADTHMTCSVLGTAGILAAIRVPAFCLITDGGARPCVAEYYRSSLADTHRHATNCIDLFCRSLYRCHGSFLADTGPCRAVESLHNFSPHALTCVFLPNSCSWRTNSQRHYLLSYPSGACASGWRWIIAYAVQI